MAAGADRILVIDGLRGYFLVFMTLNHMIFQDGAWLKRLNHAELGFVEDAQGFVFLSGLVVGMSYAASLQRHGQDRLWRKATGRLGELYRVILALLAILLAAAVVLPDAGSFWKDYLGGIVTAPKAYLSGAVMLVYQPSFVDILPQYMIYLLLAPWLVQRVQRGQGLWVVLASVAVWGASQFELHSWLGSALGYFATNLIPPFGEGEARSYFNPLAWQMLFVVGLVIGVEFQTGLFTVDRAFSRGKAPLAAACALAFLFFMACKLIVTYPGHLSGLAFFDHFVAVLDRPNLSLIHVLNFIATGYLFGWILVNGRATGSRLLRGLSTALYILLTTRFLVLLGRHSLYVYAWHVLVVYGLLAVDWYVGPFSEGAKTLLILAGIGSLALPALWRQRRTAVQRYA